MKPYTKIQDFLQDRSFVEWVLNSDEPSGPTWEKMASDKHTGLLINQAKLILQELDSPGSDWDEQEQLVLLSKIHYRIHKKKQPDINPLKSRASVGNSISRSPFWERASTVLFIFFITFLAILAIDVVKTKEVVEHEKDENAVVWITKFNPKGQKSKIHLPDGSTVIINAESEIKFRNDFGETHRDILMTGEAFFEVAPDSLLPFRVFSKDLITTALGTSFNINSYNPDHIQVQLATGKVEVKSESPAIVPILLQPGEELSVIGSQKLKKTKFNPKKAFLWKSGILFFDNASLKEFTQTLERWYGVEIEIENTPVQPLKIRGEFKDTYLSDVLESIGYAYGFDYKINQKKVKLVFSRK